MHATALIVATVSMVGFASPFIEVAAGQGQPGGAVDVIGGWTGFADESIIHHGAFGAAARLYVTPRVGVGPEVVYMIGPGTDRDLFIMAALTYEWPLLVRTQVARVSPFVVVAGGLMRHQSRFGRRTSEAGALVGGAGVRMRITDRVAAGPEFRFGWEPQIRLSGVVTVRLGPL
jgi:hypothetical protein